MVCSQPQWVINLLAIMAVHISSSKRRHRWQTCKRVKSEKRMSGLTIASDCGTESRSQCTRGYQYLPMYIKGKSWPACWVDVGGTCSKCEGFGELIRFTHSTWSSHYKNVLIFNAWLHLGCIHPLCYNDLSWISVYNPLSLYYMSISDFFKTFFLLNRRVGSERRVTEDEE